MLADEPIELVLNRECGSCSLCCKLIAVTELEKPEGTWCAHCSPGANRCQIYSTRPASCKGFHCGWRQSDEFGLEWQPTISKMVIAAEGDGNRLTVYVDPSFPTNWRKEPYISQLRHLAELMPQLKRQLIVRIKNRFIVLLPNKEVDLGDITKDDQVISFRNRLTGEWGARLILAKDVPLEERGKWIVG